MTITFLCKTAKQLIKRRLSRPPHSWDNVPTAAGLDEVKIDSMYIMFQQRQDWKRQNIDRK